MANILELPQYICSLPNGKRVLNVTAVPLRFADEHGEVFIAEPCGYIICPNDDHAEKLLHYISNRLHRVMVVGTRDAAELFGGYVVAPVPLPGYDHKPLAQQFLSCDLFSSY